MQGRTESQQLPPPQPFHPEQHTGAKSPAFRKEREKGGHPAGSPLKPSSGLSGAVRPARIQHNFPQGLCPDSWNCFGPQDTSFGLDPAVLSCRFSVPSWREGSRTGASAATELGGWLRRTVRRVPHPKRLLLGWVFLGRSSQRRGAPVA